MTVPYPFSAVVGLDDLRQALLLTAVSPAIGGVLVRGEKGTAKSTVVRALAALLPSIDVVPGCRFACDPAAPDPSCPDGPHTPAGVVSRQAPLVELPVGATEDRVVGTLDLQRALADGTKAYEPGLLAAAHRGALYVDEVNLLPDHLVDLLLDAAAMGRAHVERDGVSVKHAARFLLVGTMNPEEGEPRPQLVDRFGLVVTVAAPREAGQRAEVVRRRLAYEADPAAFALRWAADERDLAGRIVTARDLLPSVALPDAELDRIARICIAYAVDGMRADIVVARAAIALAAWRGKTVVSGDEVRDAARLALPHRRRRDPLDPPGADEEKLEEALNEAGADQDPPEPPEPDGSDGGPDDGGPDDGGGPADGSPSAGPAGGPEAAPPSQAPPKNGSPETSTPPAGPGKDQKAQPAPVGFAFRPKAFTVTGRGEGAHAGRRSPAFARRGRVVGARSPLGRRNFAPHLPATLRAAIGRGSRTVEAVDLREAVHVGREANLVLFVVDASGSMAARQRMRTVKTAVLSLLRDAYQRRDRIGMITFRGGEATTVLPPTSSHEVGVARLAELRTGGRTPLAAGLRSAATVIAAERRRDPRRRPLLVVVTDGRATSGPDPLTVTPALAGTAAVVVDCESGPVRLGLARRLAGALAADWMPLDRLSASAISVRTA
ncbi:magnesium chelatase subunit D family protein [Catenuloplanes sp. NPDC051500]|uniref:magnesium chelatase subunit D family protein n=1 Tax=Catenuloplanes sp. NPDC051500 TaxID=3363959 RepID=UPI00378A95C5